MDMKTIFRAVVDGDAPGAEGGVRSALDEGVEPEFILRGALIPAMDEVGRRFEAGEFFVPEMLISARAMKAGIAILRPLLVESGIEPVGRVVIGTVKGDLHDIGKNLVGLMMEGAGFEVVDAGTDVSAESFVETVGREKPQILGMSALLTTTMPDAANVIRALSEAGLRDGVKVMVGGAPVTQEFADKIGADGYAPDAAAAARKAKELLGLL